MILYQKSPSRNYQDISRQLLKASGINSNCRPHGFEGIAGFDFGDIYIDEALADCLTDSLRSEIDGCLRRIVRDDFGEVTADEREENTDNRYFGNGKGIIARFALSALPTGKIEVRVEEDCTKIRII